MSSDSFTFNGSQTPNGGTLTSSTFTSNDTTVQTVSVKGAFNYPSNSNLVTDSTYFLLASGLGLVGPTGYQGVTGATGPAGSNGLPGATGPAGATGSSGASQLGIANTWTALQTFSGGISTTSETDSGALTVYGNTTLGTNSSNTLTVNSAATFNVAPTMSGANITASTIPSSAISGGLSVSLPTTGPLSITSNTQMGYTQKVTNTSTTSITAAIACTLAYLTLNGPVGSVWLVFSETQFTNPCSQGGSWVLQQGSSTWQPNGNNFGASFVVSGHTVTASLPYQVSNSTVVTVSAGNGNIINLGCYLYGSGTSHYYTSITATRIA